MIDWKKLILALRKSGWSDTAIGVEIGRSRGWINKLCNRNGAETLTWKEGITLLDFAYDHLPEAELRECRQ